MNIKHSLLLLLFLWGVQGCSESDKSGSSVVLGGVITIPIASCSEGVTALQMGDELNKTLSPTTLRMSYGEDGSRRSCVVSGAAVLMR